MSWKIELIRISEKPEDIPGFPSREAPLWLPSMDVICMSARLCGGRDETREKQPPPLKAAPES